MESILSAHGDSGKVPYEALKDYATPPATGHWKPVPHLALVDTLKNEASKYHNITHEEYAVSKNGTKLFGVMDLESELVPGMGKSIGFRHSNDKQIAIQIVAGGRVFVCDNMVLAGSMIVLKAKHTWGFNLQERISTGLERWQQHVEIFREKVIDLSHKEITEGEGQAILAQSLYDGVITFQTFKVAYDLYFERAVRIPEEYEDCAPRTAWSLHNALSRALKLATPNAQFNGTMAVSRQFGLA